MRRSQYEDGHLQSWHCRRLVINCGKTQSGLNVPAICERLVDRSSSKNRVGCVGMHPAAHTPVQEPLSEGQHSANARDIEQNERSHEQAWQKIPSDPSQWEPDDASQFLTTLECITLSLYDINDDGTVDNADLVMLVTIVINESMSSSDINYDQYVDIFDILILSDYLEGI